MDWIKRNLVFVICGGVALGLMIAGIYFLIAQISDEKKVSDQIAAQYSELTRLYQLNPNPGDANIDNIKIAKEQDAAIRAYITKIRPFFQPIPAIPETAGTNKVSNSDFAAQLRNTVSSLHRSAELQSVILPPDYYFTFESQKKLMLFDPASLDQLAMQLGEIKGLCDILFAAKINSLDGIRREAVSPDDNTPSDFLADKTVSTPLADVEPYQVTFRCFSTELAFVLSHLAASPNGFVVKSINVEPTASNGGDEASEAAPGMPQPRSAYPTYQPGFQPTYQPGGNGYGARMRPQPGVEPVPAPGLARNSQIFLNEKPFRVTLTIELIKLKPASK